MNFLIKILKLNSKVKSYFFFFKKNERVPKKIAKALRFITLDRVINVDK